MDMISMKMYKYIDEAATEANKSSEARRHGCVIVDNGKIIGRGHNNYRTQSRDGFIRGMCSCHAEISAIRDSISNKNVRDRYKYRSRRCKLCG